MPISREHNLTFIHIPKTGGVTIEKLFKMEHKDSLWCINGPLSEGRSTTIDGVNFAPQHYTWDILEDTIPNFYENSIKFTFVRNPYTRILSEYFWLTRKNTFNPQNFHTWLVKFLSKIDNDHKIPQTDFIPNDINFIGKTESMNQDLKHFIKEYNLPFTVDDKSHNKSKMNKTELIPLLLDESRLLIKKVYELDFVNFNYEF